MLKLYLVILVSLVPISLLGQRAKAPTAWSEQQVIVAGLTGILPAADNYWLSSRWAAKERKISRDYLQAFFLKSGFDLQEQEYTMPNLYALQDLLLGPYRGTNLYGILPSTNPSNEYVLLGAHYDTERNAPGANDNASAIAVIHGVVQQMAAFDNRNKNLLIVFFDQEEEGNVGSRAFLKHLDQQSWKITSAHTIDQMGWDNDGDRAIELELPNPDLERQYQQAGEQLGIKVHTTGVDASDHQAFRASGYVVTGITEEFANGDTSPFKDSEKDTFETIDFGYLTSTTSLLSLVFSELLEAH